MQMQKNGLIILISGLTNWTDGVPINLQNRSLSAAAAFEEETVIRIREVIVYLSEV